jgi:hypothetical protein
MQPRPTIPSSTATLPPNPSSSTLPHFPNTLATTAVLRSISSSVTIATTMTTKAVTSAAIATRTPHTYSDATPSPILTVRLAKGEPFAFSLNGVPSAGRVTLRVRNEGGRRARPGI